MQTRRHYGSLRYLRNRALTFTSITNSVALAILVVRSTADQSGLHYLYALNLLSFLSLATLWWRYVNFPTHYVLTGSYGHTFVDFVMSAVGIYEVLRKWRSPATGVEYPVSVVVSDCGDVAGFRLEAMSDDQEFLSRVSRFKGYWEGCCNVYRDSDKVGQANLEVVRT